MQPVQDLTIDDHGQPDAVPVHPARTPIPTSSPHWAPKLVDKLNTLPELADVASDLPSTAACRPMSTIDRDTAGRFGITPATVDNALYDAFGQRIVSTIFTQSNQYRVILEADPEPADARCSRCPTIYLPSSTGTGQVPLSVIAKVQRADRAAADRSSRPVPGGHDLLQPGARRLARRRRSTAIKQARADIGLPAQRHHQLPGRGAGVPVLARATSCS